MSGRVATATTGGRQVTRRGGDGSKGQVTWQTRGPIVLTCADLPLDEAEGPPALLRDLEGLELRLQRAAVVGRLRRWGRDMDAAFEEAERLLRPKAKARAPEGSRKATKKVASTLTSGPPSPPRSVSSPSAGPWYVIKADSRRAALYQLFGLTDPYRGRLARVLRLPGGPTGSAAGADVEGTRAGPRNVLVELEGGSGGEGEGEGEGGGGAGGGGGGRSNGSGPGVRLVLVRRDRSLSRRPASTAKRTGKFWG
jgi:hypothetical protein